MKFTFAIVSLAVLYCTVNAASIGNANELDPLVKSVTKKITGLVKTLETTTPIKEITEAGEQIINAAEVLISETSDMLDNENLQNDINVKDEKKVDIMQFIAQNVVDADEVVQILFADDQLDEDDWRTVLLVRSLFLGGEGLQFEFDQFTSASSDEDKRFVLKNIRVWCQAITRISGALISAADDAEMTLRAQIGMFSDDGEQQAPSDQDLTIELPPSGEDETSDKLDRQRRQIWRRGPWGVGGDGITYTRGRHTFGLKPTFTGFRPTGATFSWRFRF